MEEEIREIREIIKYLELMKKNIDFSKLGYVYGDETLEKTILKLNRLEQDERVIEEMAKQIEKDTEWYLSDFEDMTVEDIIDHFRKKCE